MTLTENYDHKEVEKKWIKEWEKQDIYKFNPTSKKPIFSIDTPPPYASAGHLHVGHALHYTQFEIVARVMRQLGMNVYFPPGFDDNGLPTEKYVEEKLNINKAKTNRARFREICLKESKKVEDLYSKNVFKRLGHSYDWNLLYTTISPEAQKVTQTVFLKLVKKGDCYRKEEPTIWCPHHETALAQAEVEDLKRTTKLSYINFDMKDSKEKITIATTRPEFLPACVGIFVHPDDKKYKKLIGKEVIVPLFKHKVKIMEDETVDKEFGTGMMMTCTFGDNSDIEKWKKYKLELRSILNKDGTLNKLSGKYEGIKSEQARKQIMEELEKEKRIKKQENIQQTVGSCWRCNTPVEYIITKQWFIKTLCHKEDLIKRGNEIKWYPEFMKTRFEDWTNNLGWDWIISRQRYYGVPIPVWYCEKCNQVIFPEEKELPVDPIETEKKCPKCSKKTKPETDVFDTWMTSSNSPEIASQWLKNPALYKRMAPMSLRPQSHDIIRTWAFYTILKSHLLFDRIPWKEVMICTYVLDPKGKGMSKSKGNAVWADEIIEKYGVDIFRYWVGTASLGSDLLFKEQELIAGRKFLTKLWNASRFVFMHLKNYKDEKPKKLELIDEYMLCRLSKLVEFATKKYRKYDIAEAKKMVENFFWHDFCDNYLEIIKDRLYNEERKKEGKISAQHTIKTILTTLLKLMAPITPFITEEIYQHLNQCEEKLSTVDCKSTPAYKIGSPCKSIHTSEWPKLMVKLNSSLEEAGQMFTEILSEVRKYKAKNNLSMKTEIGLTLTKKSQALLMPFLEDLQAVTKAKEIVFNEKFSIKKI
ncbi:MAG: valine--tRNA ligase [Nanoarchaeota archaeon]|nr:valine--tRNA ligase [Nanoarchaeota archaeon]